MNTAKKPVAKAAAAAIAKAPAAPPERQMTAQEFVTQATLDALCAQRNNALDQLAQASAQTRIAQAERDAIRKIATDLLSKDLGSEAWLELAAAARAQLGIE